MQYFPLTFSQLFCKIPLHECDAIIRLTNTPLRMYRKREMKPAELLPVLC